MGITNWGFLQFGSFLKGDSPAPPSYMVFGTGSELFTGSINYLINDVVRKEITWSWNGSNIRANASLLTTDAIGSNIQELGFGVGSALTGSDLYSRDLSAIGDKTDAFSVSVTSEVKFKRAI